MKNHLFIGLGLVFTSYAGWSADVPFPDADGSHDIGSAAAWGSVTPQPGDMIQFAGGKTYVLSADKSLPGPMQMTGTGKTVFDFSKDQKTLTVNGDVQDAASVGRETVLKGGNWNLTDGFRAYFHNNACSLLLDGVMMTTARALPQFDRTGTLASNSSCVLTNGTKVTITAGSDYPYFRASGSNWCTNNEILVTGGSELTANAALRFGGTYGSFTDGHAIGNRFVVRGAGSKVVSGSETLLGYQSGDMTILIEDGGWMNSQNLRIGGSGGSVVSSRNMLIVRNGGVCTNVNEVKFGYARGSVSNRVFVLDRGQLNVGRPGQFKQLHVGDNGSSYNSLTISNGMVTARWVSAGQHKDSHDNRIEISGSTSQFVPTDGGTWRLFGAGYGNEVVVDNGADFTYGTTKLSTVPDSGIVHGSNNTFAVRHASTFRHNLEFELGDGVADALNTRLEVSGGSHYLGGNATLTLCSVGGSVAVTEGSELSVGAFNVGNSTRDFPGSRVCVSGLGSSLSASTASLKVSDSEISVDDGASMTVKGNLTIGLDDSAASSNNTLFVGTGAVVTQSVNSAKFNVLSKDSALVISNGTVCLSAGYGKLRMGVKLNDSDQFIGKVGTNTKLVFQGEHPLLTATEGNAQIYLGGSYNWPEEQNVPVTIRYELPPNGYAASPVQNCLQVWASKDLTIELGGLEECQKTIAAKTTFPLWETTFAFADDGFAKAVERLNETLPKGCSAQIETLSEGPVKQRLTLTVKPTGRGILLIVR